MFFNIAHAATEVTAAATGESGVSAASGLASFVPMLLILLVFYFLLLRPQMKKQKELSNMISGLKNGDKVVAAGGIIGTVVKIEDDVMHLEISRDYIIKVLKHTVSDKINKDLVRTSVEDVKTPKKTTKKTK
jgi:preprotein translocase subunit YajC